MGLATIIISFFLLSLAFIILCPLLYYFVTAKLVVFENRTFKNYALFWVLLIVINSVIGLLTPATMVEAGDPKLALDQLTGYSNYNLLITFILQVILAIYLFKAPPKKAFGAAIAYNILFAISFVVLGFAAIQLSFFSLSS